MSVCFRLPGAPLPELDSIETVKQKLKNHKLVLILFNTDDPPKDSIESKFRLWRANYDSKGSLHIYKCVVSFDPNELEKEFKVEKSPTFLFFCGGEETARLEDADNVRSSSTSANTTGPVTAASVNNTEQQLKNWLDTIYSTTSSS